ncbi:MAG: Unknown protein [uncultured Sulfurovum sp.]|uniref:Uncharacterized protein n=1 Tax=uncultured Sulfurovum sp. TaxID=269237 RepID=A0A6S6SQT2_9BACT|nr:MAG: Unknown protein [uncultured Sulfurovum sp.]
MFSILQVSEAMNKTKGWDCTWWNNKEICAVIDYADKKGWVSRFSITQVEWTNEGAMEYKTLKLQTLAEDEVASGRLTPIDKNEEAQRVFIGIKPGEGIDLCLAYDAIINEALIKRHDEEQKQKEEV